MGSPPNMNFVPTSMQITMENKVLNPIYLCDDVTTPRSFPYVNITLFELIFLAELS